MSYAADLRAVGIGGSEAGVGDVDAVHHARLVGDGVARVERVEERDLDDLVVGEADLRLDDRELRVDLGGGLRARLHDLAVGEDLIDRRLGRAHHAGVDVDQE